MKSLVVIIVCIAFANGNCQSIEWQKCITGGGNDEPNCIIPTFDGGLIIAGTTQSTDSSIGQYRGGWGDFWVVKFDNSKKIQWSKCYGGSDADVATSICQRPDSSYIVCGYTNSNDSDISNGMNHGQIDIWVIKIDNTGNLIWQLNFGGSLDDKAIKVINTNDDGFAVAGYTSSKDGDFSTNRGGSDICLLKFNKKEKLEWIKCYGGTNIDNLYDIISTSDSGYAMVGYTLSNNGDVSGNNGGLGDFWLLKLGRTGDADWQKCLGGSGTDSGKSIKSTKDGGYILLGTTNSTDSGIVGQKGLADLWLLKLTKTGIIEWQKCYGGSGKERAAEVQIIPEGFLLAGSTASNDNDIKGNHGGYDIVLFKCNENGSIIWQRCYGGSKTELCNGLMQDSIGDIYLISSTNSFDGDVVGKSGFNDDAWILKLSDNIGINEPNSFQQQFLNVYPNPSIGSFIITYKIAKKETLTIYNMLGELISNEILQPGQTEKSIDVTSLSKGIYIVRLGNATQKIVLE